MGNSAIASIYGVVAGWAPTPSSDIAVNVQAYGAANETIHSDMLPMRKIQAFANESEGEMAYIALGHTVNVVWTIKDRFYFRFATQGQGWVDFADELTAYSASYINTMRTNRAPTSQSHILNARFVPGIFTFPDGSDNRIAGVDVILTIEEVIA